MNKKRGISLITLIITIIVIIILAGAIILSLNNTNVIENANKAVTEQDKLSLIDTYNMIAMDNFVGNTTKDEPMVNVDINELYSKIGKNLGDKFRVERNGLLQKQEDGSYNVISKFPNSISYTRNRAYSAYNKPYIPLDFDYLEGTWDTGLVIKNREDNNEFVWIPVKKDVGNKDDDKFYYKKRDFYGSYISSSNTKNDTIPLAPKETNSDNIARIEKENVEKYGGFYIGRYEAATENERTRQVEKIDLIIQPLKPVYNFVLYKEAKELSEKLYRDKKDYVSTLTTGTQWDTACMFLGESYANNSTGNGNYSRSLQYTGVDGYKLNNVYDMAGNAAEYTNETSNSNAVMRGGAYINVGSMSPAGDRNNNLPRMSIDYNSFRVSLFLK